MDSEIDLEPAFSEAEYAELVRHRKAGIQTRGTDQEQPFMELCRRYYDAYPLTRERLAWHEAGHVVVAYALGYDVLAVWKISADHWDTLTDQAPLYSDDFYAITIAGYLAEDRQFGHCDPAEAWIVARSQADRSSSSRDERQALVFRIETAVNALLDENWTTVARIAEVLLGSGDFIRMYELTPLLQEVARKVRE